MIRHVMAMIVGVGLTSFGFATEIHLYEGATQEENRQLQGLSAARRLGQVENIKYLDHLLDEHPANGTARLLRADALVQLGQMDKAWKDLDYLEKHNPEGLGAASSRINYYRIKGDGIHELEEIKRLEGMKFTDNTAKVFAEVSIRSNRPRAAELSGNAGLTKKEWQEWVDGAHPQMRANHMIDQVQFYLRQGDYDDAVAVAKAAVELHRRQSHEGTSLANALTWYGLSLWGSGKRMEALAAFLDAAEQPIEEFYSNYSRSFFDPSRRSVAILGARVLAASGTDKDKARVVKVMSDLSKSASGKWPYSLEPVVLALTGGSEMKPVVDAVAKVLKQAPNLDWALWAALYLGLSGQDEAKSLLTLLPNGTIQRRIAEQEGNVPTIHPSNLGRE